MFLFNCTGEAKIDPAVLISGGTMLKEQARQQLAGPRFLMTLLTGFALFAALVARRAAPQNPMQALNEN